MTAAFAFGFLLLIVVFVWVIPILVARSIGRAKHRRGALYGLMSWLGVLIVAILPPQDTRRTT